MALYFQSAYYEKPLKEFLNTFMGAYRDLKIYPAEEISSVFEQTTEIIDRSVGGKALTSGTQ